MTMRSLLVTTAAIALGGAVADATPSGQTLQIGGRELASESGVRLLELVARSVGPFDRLSKTWGEAALRR